MSKKVLFIDRDGTLVIEPPVDYQLDSLEKLEFYPGVFQWLAKINQELDYTLVMVTNQDGLGTESFPEETFWPAHNKVMQAFSNEGIEFYGVHIDPTLPEDNAPTRKPGTGMLMEYIHGDFDLEKSFVIGDRTSDVVLAQNLGSQGILIGDEPFADAALTTKSWEEIYLFLKGQDRKAMVNRNTSETQINIALNLDGKGESVIQTGLGFYDHMLEQIAKHGGFDLDIRVQGDLHIDEHHTIEDTALALGTAFKEALGSKKGIMRYGFLLPMDDALAQVAVDFGGRPWLEWDAEFKREKVGDLPTEMFFHFFKSFSDTAQCNLNIKAEGDNEHHKIEAIFKGFARALRMAVSRSGSNDIPSTKGSL
ncbi:bifunctional histidinol-phosphatase/imidazoleglycerol-phosphate dehydratase HisB [Gilvibacter sediminis]|uniref:bifunctional histidinol-phosphatase/imidazoleglycerol-phosphate dehydratase HisB n=1 Tax=Gilvibacter sediminis TaxID=379071 RepID=UPI0023505507|nr:bifunctional histidinol-phosphatase/imidazoleglycerol-phosphate dehydratase HisB [Gilvibacter sediminis]MDC7997897.1 bifunctional histidinol-phosphatase/imidazoleglycerol-phosphate dehydratase HisB [Gilvibacter sediminis]